jgi:protein-tyrosine phosphatase
MAEVVLRAMLDAAGFGDRVVVDSGSTDGWHVGEPADPRTLATLTRAGYDGTSHRARQLEASWLATRDLVLATDHRHMKVLKGMSRSRPTTRLKLLREFDPAAVAAGSLEVADPYYGGEKDFQRCLHEVEAACSGLVNSLGAMLDERP